MKSFDAGWKSGADFVETDVRKTHDDVLVVHHDPQLVDGRLIRDLDFKDLPLLPDGQSIPTLAQVVEEAQRRGGRIAVEIKEPGYEQRVVSEIMERLPVEQFNIISFHPSAIERVERIDKDIRTGLLGPRVYDWMRTSPLATVATWLADTLNWHPTVERAAQIGADYVSMYHRMVTPRFVKDAHAHGLQAVAWTPDRAIGIVAAIEHGVDGVVSNNAPLALKLRDSMAGDEINSPAS